jgi:AraC-like DNA-binding protein
MSISRQYAEPAVRGYSVTHPPGTAVLPVEAGWDQLLYAASGAMTVTISTGSWIIPQHRALWIPDNQAAAVSHRSRVAVRSLYFASSAQASRVLPCRPRAMTISRFCRELLVHTVRCCPLDLDEPVHAALLTVLLDQLRGQPEVPLWLPRPTDPRAAAFALAAAGDPTADTGRVAQRVGASRRTLERIFVAETGMSLGAWRRRAHILGSLDLLATGASVTAAGIAAGYGTPSAYVTAFQRELGVTPGQFVRL